MPETAQTDKASAAFLAQKLGADLAEKIMPMIKIIESALDSDVEKVVWWYAFLGYLSGACAASIGPGALDAITQANVKLVSDLLASKAH